MRYLISRNATGQAICPAAIIDNAAVEARRYSVEEHIVTLDGQPDAVLGHDYMALLCMPGGMYRPMTPAEQNALRLKQDKAAMIEEGT